MRLTIGADGIATLTFDAPGAPVNTMTAQWQREMIEAVEQLHAQKDRLRGVLLESAKQTFFAGAPLKHLLTLREADAPAAFDELQAIKRAYRRLETLGRPVVALLGGAALGGGWEIALAAHARFARDDETIRFGMPEVTLGLIPGATGIVKTVRLLGLAAAWPLLGEGRLIAPAQALELGLVQGLGRDAAELRAQALAWIDAHPDAAQPWDGPAWRLPGGEAASPRVAAWIAAAPAALAARGQAGYPAPQAVLEAMVEGALVDFDTATRIESRKLARVMVGPVARNMIGAFFFDRRAVAADGGTDEAAAAALARRLGAAKRSAGEAPAAAAADVIERERCLLRAQADEAARCLAEGVLPSAAHANLVSIERCGFPAWSGGAIRFLSADGARAHEQIVAATRGRAARP